MFDLLDSNSSFDVLFFFVVAYACWRVLMSSSDILSKAFWLTILFFFPIGGWIFWFVVWRGPLFLSNLQFSSSKYRKMPYVGRIQPKQRHTHAETLPLFHALAKNV